MKTAIIYAYFETVNAVYNLEFYAQIGITNDLDHLYVFVINGEQCSVNLPQQDNVIVLKRPNIGFDFGAHGHAIKYLLDKYTTTNLIENLPFDYFIFMNCGVIGPFIPTYYPQSLHWSTIFSNKITDKVKLVSTTIVCLPLHDVGGYGPKIEGFCFCTDRIGLKVFMDNGTIFVDHKTKYDAIVKGEYQISNVCFKKGYTIDCLLYKYSNVDWMDKKNWSQNNNKHPSRAGTYDGISIHPFEVVFHKMYWSHEPKKLVSHEFVDKYKSWKLQEKNGNHVIMMLYGVEGCTINVTNILLERFRIDNVISIPKDCDLSLYFGNPCFDVEKKLIMVVDGKRSIFSETGREQDIKIIIEQ